jgi:GNAT superfamily N-acetyltransferase
MEYITIDEVNIDKEHICCAISNNSDPSVALKKAWLSERFKEGLVFRRGDVRGKVFIEYIPAENAWAPIDAPGYTYIDCLLVSGQYKGHGCADELLDACIKDSKDKGRKGLCVLSSQGKKKPFLSDPGYLAHKGFKTADTTDPFFSLMYLPFDGSAPIPRFRECVKDPKVADGLVIYYADQCPYATKYVRILADTAEKNGIGLSVFHIDTPEKARSAPTPFTSFSVFRDGRLLTNEIPSEQKFIKIATSE